MSSVYNRDFVVAVIGCDIIVHDIHRASATAYLSALKCICVWCLIDELLAGNNCNSNFDAKHMHIGSIVHIPPFEPNAVKPEIKY